MGGEVVAGTWRANFLSFLRNLIRFRLARVRDFSHVPSPTVRQEWSIVGTKQFASNYLAGGVRHEQDPVSERASRPCREIGAKRARYRDRGKATGLRGRVPVKGKVTGRAAGQCRLTCLCRAAKMVTPLTRRRRLPATNLQAHIGALRGHRPLASRSEKFAESARALRPRLTPLNRAGQARLPE